MSSAYMATMPTLQIRNSAGTAMRIHSAPGSSASAAADRQRHDQVTDGEPTAPVGVGQFVPYPLPVPVRQPGAEREQRLPLPGPDLPEAWSPVISPLSSQMAAPAVTVWPTSTDRPVTVPSL